MTPWDDAIAQWSFDKGLPAGAGTDTLPGVPYQILPLKSGEKTYGLVVVEPGNLRQLMIPEQQRLLETFTLLVANALERLTLTASEEQARMANVNRSATPCWRRFRMIYARRLRCCSVRQKS